MTGLNDHDVGVQPEGITDGDVLSLLDDVVRAVNGTAEEMLDGDVAVDATVPLVRAHLSFLSASHDLSQSKPA